MHGSLKFVRAIGVLLLLGGIGIFCLTAFMNYYQGEMWAVTEHGKNINRWSAVIIDAVGIVVIGFAAGAAFAARKRGWGWFLTLIMLLSAVASINSMASFQATERMSASKTREAANDRVAMADDLTKSAATKAMKAATSTRYRSIRRDFIEANKDAIESIRNAKVEVQVAPDAGAELWATLSGWSLERIQLFQAAYLAILLIILKMVCFQASGFFLNPLAWMKSTTVSSSQKGGSGDGGGGGETIAPQVKSSEETKAKVATVSSKLPENVTPIREINPVRSATVGALPPSLKPSRSIVEILAERPSVSQSALAAMTGKSPATVSRELKWLEGRKKIDRKRKGRGVQVSLRRDGGLRAVGL